MASKDDDGGLAMQAILFVCYLCAQSSMTFYMKWLLSEVRVSGNLVGVPASFWVTAVQQMSGFVLVLVFIAGSALVGRPYRPKKLASQKEGLLVLLLSISFSLSVGLNLFSLALIPLSLTFIIRSCMPLSTAIMQTLIQGKAQDISRGEWACMTLGVLCACLAVVAQSGGPHGSGTRTFYFGVAMSVSSIFCGGLDMVFKSVLGMSVKLSPTETIFYMAIPVFVLTGLIGLIPKPVSSAWAAVYSAKMADWMVFKELWALSPMVLALVASSGCVAFCYNVFTTTLVQRLSPATTSFAGNFNKAAMTTISFIFLEGQLPAGARGPVLCLAIAGNIASFCAYNVLRTSRKNQAVRSAT